MFIKDNIKRHHQEKESVKGRSSMEELKHLSFFRLEFNIMFWFELFFFFHFPFSLNFPERIKLLKLGIGLKAVTELLPQIWLLASYLYR